MLLNFCLAEYNWKLALKQSNQWFLKACCFTKYNQAKFRGIAAACLIVFISAKFIMLNWSNSESDEEFRVEKQD